LANNPFEQIWLQSLPINQRHGHESSSFCAKSIGGYAVLVRRTCNSRFSLISPRLSLWSDAEMGRTLGQKSAELTSGVGKLFSFVFQLSIQWKHERGCRVSVLGTGQPRKHEAGSPAKRCQPKNRRCSHTRTEGLRQDHGRSSVGRLASSHKSGERLHVQ